jgi:hypothetical protein
MILEKRLKRSKVRTNSHANVVDIILGQEEKATIEYIETCIIRQDPLHKVLRLLCLMSITRNGLGQKEYDHLRTEMVHVSFSFSINQIVIRTFCFTNSTQFGKTWNVEIVFLHST